MLSVTLRQLEYLVAVADARTVAAAADQCLVSPVAVGQGLAELDRQLGTELTRRRRAKGVELTPAGAAVVKRARVILRDVALLPMVIDAETERRSRHLRIGVFTSLSTWAVPALLKHFSATAPDVVVDYMEGDIDQLHRSLDQGEVDMILANRNQLADGGTALQVFPVQVVRPYILVAEDHPLADSEGIHFADVTDEDFVLLAVNPAHKLMMDVLDRYGLGQNVRWMSRNVETVNGIVGSGLAIALQFSFGHNRMSLDGERLVSIPVVDPMPENVAVVCIPEGLKVPPLVAEAIRHLRQWESETGQPARRRPAALTAWDPHHQAGD